MFKNEIENNQKVLTNKTICNTVIPVIFSVGMDYVPYLAVAIQSLKEHISKNYFYDIHILCLDLPDDLAKRIEALSEANLRISIKKIEANMLPVDLKKCIPEKLHVTIATYFRFLIADLFPCYEKMIYLDSDIIVQSDIAELYNINIGDNWLAASINRLTPALTDYVLNKLNIEPWNYFNAGVLIFNLKEWRKNNVSELCWNYLSTLTQDPPLFVDQDVLNIICKKKIYFVDEKWNYLMHPTNDLYRRCNSLKRRKLLPDEIAIIHYITKNKPWNCPKDTYRTIWWKYARKTSFYEELLLKYEIYHMVPPK